MASGLFLVIVVLVLGVCAALLSASETAITASSHIRLHQLAKRGNAGAKTLLEIQDPSLISSILLANTWILTAMTSLATHVLAKLLGKMGVLWVSLFMGAFITIYIEVLPKIFVYKSPERVGVFFAPVLERLKKIFAPISLVVDKIARLSLRLFGVSISSRRHGSSLEDLRGAIDLHVGEGRVPHERAMLRSILDLSSVTVGEIMVHRSNILSFSVDTLSEELYDEILNAPYTRIPLWKDTPDNIVGVISAKKIIRAAGQGLAKKVPISDIMVPPWFVPETTVLFEQLQSFRERRIHQAFVIDEYGALLGMVTLEDILEEIVGEIFDESDIRLQGVRTTAEGDYLVQGWVTLRDLNRRYDWELPSARASTLAGLVLHEAKAIPKVGEKIVFGKFEMEVLRGHAHQVDLVRVRVIKEEEKTDKEEKSSSEEEEL